MVSFICNHKKCLFIEYGPALIEHALLKFGFTNASKVGKTFNITDDLPKLMEAIQEADSILESAKKQPFKVFYFAVILSSIT